MADINDLLATAADNSTEEETWEYVSGYESVEYSDDQIIKIDLKSIGDLSQQVSVSGEIDSQYIMFEHDRYYDGVDLSTKRIMIHWERDDADGTLVGDNNIAVNVQTTSTKLRFAWLVHEPAARIRNSTLRVMPFMYSAQNGQVNYMLKTRYIVYNIYDGLNLTNGLDSSVMDTDYWYKDFIASMQNYVSNASSYANEAKAASEEAALLATDLDIYKSNVDDLNDNAFQGVLLEDNIYWFTNANGDKLMQCPTGTGGSGGGGSTGNSATLTVTNTTGWLTKSLSAGSECQVTLNWYSIDGEVSTGNGSMTVRVNNVTKFTVDVPQGSVSADLTDYLSVGTNKVKVQIVDSFDNSKTITFTINIVDISISSSFDSSLVYSANTSITFTYIPVGAVEKTVYFIVDGVQQATATVKTTGRQQTQTLQGMLHGSHSLLVYFTAVVDGSEVKSNELYYEIIVSDYTSNIPIITSNFHETEVTQYTTLNIPYMVYTPSDLTSAVSLYVGDTLVNSLTVDRTEQNWSYRVDTIGTVTLKIVSGVVQKTIELTVTESDIDVEAETDALALYLTSYGRSNNENDPSIWKYNDIEASLTNFTYVSDGWVTDDDGISTLRVSGDARVDIPYQAFASDLRATGKTFEIEFATSDVRNYDSVIFSCMSGGRGIELTAQKATMKSEQSEVSTQYKEDEHVRISFVAEKRSENRLLYIYINGIMSGAVQYPSDDDFSQVSPVDITIGSNDCTIDVYCIRVYDNDLTRYQILNNWIADTQKVDLMLERYKHNQVYDDYGNVVIANLPNDLPYLVVTCAELPQYKGDKKTVSGYYVDPADDAKSFTFTGAEANVQGTSSQYYARKNYKIKFKNGFVDSNQTTSKGYKLRDDSIATNTFTFKADVASSEGANNVELVRLYNNACPYKTPAQEANSEVRQGIDGLPIVMFWNDGSNITFLGKYNFNNDKGTEEVYGFDTGDESWEVLNNTSDRVLWKSADFSGTDWQNDFEARYPEDNTDTTNLKKFAAWLVTTDTTAATNATLASSFTFEGATYTKDTAEYRVAKFKSELENYIEKDSAIFYYLFTELFLMVDSRAKNMFPSFIGEESSTV